MEPLKGEFFASIAQDRVAIWSCNRFISVRLLLEETWNPIKCIKYIKDRNLLLAASEWSGKIIICDYETGELLRVLEDSCDFREILVLGEGLFLKVFNTHLVIVNLDNEESVCEIRKSKICKVLFKSQNLNSGWDFTKLSNEQYAIAHDNPCRIRQKKLIRSALRSR